jgi:hypothetical protein
MIKEMQFLVSHPRMQQRNWVEKGHEWLPVLQYAIEDLERDNDEQNLTGEAYQGLILALERAGLKVEKRESRSWGYRWQGGELQGVFSTRTEALETAIRNIQK